MITINLHGLCYLDPIVSTDPHNRGRLVQCELFSKEETNDICNAAIVMERFFIEMDRISAITEALKEFKNGLANLVSNNPYDIAQIERRLKSYLNEFHIFLDHWKKHIGDIKKANQTFGLAYEKYYKDVTSYTYDNNESYVLAYVIRNYVVHGYDSINHCHIDGNNNEVFIYRDNLYKINISASAKQIINKQPEQINLALVAEESYKGIQNVQEQLINFQITEEICQAANTLLKAKTRIDKSEIVSTNWILIEGQRSTPQKVQAIDLAYRPLNWNGYEAVAGYIYNLRQDKSWFEIQNNYLNQI